MTRHIGKILAGVALSSALAACATPPGAYRRTAHAVTQGVVIGFDGDAVHLFGVVDPEARWTADAMTLRFDERKGELAGDVVDDGGAGGSLRLVRAR